MALDAARTDLTRMTIRDESDVFQLRGKGRQVAAAVGLDGQDQIRVATALSDVGRELVRQSVVTTAVFTLLTEPAPALVVDLGWAGVVTTTGPGWNTARMLLHDVRFEQHEHTGTVALLRNFPAGVLAPSATGIDGVRRELGAAGEGNALDELRAQNQELLETLEDLEQKRRELERANEELEETNRGVLALYKELSDELEQTNTGVVALYAELDVKTTQLREAGEARTRFWSNISHELRTPVNSVVGLTRLLAVPGADPLTDEQRRQVDLINDSGTTLLALVNELLDTAKAESGSLRPRPAPVDLNYMFVQLRGALRPMIRTDAVELVVEDLPVMPALVTDPTMLVRILRNLLSNGLKFTEAGEVRLSVREEGDRLRFVVADTGIGIPADQHDRVFEEFHQVPNRLQTGAAGTGLGLSYARTLATILGGDLSLSSTPGEGTEVVLDLPLGTVEDIPLTSVGIALLVDGADESRGRLRAEVDTLADDVVEAKDGRSALSAATGTRPDLIFLDADTPLMSGVEVLTVLRQDPNLVRVPVVLVCGGDIGGMELAASTLGAALLTRSLISAGTVRQAIREAHVAVRRTAS
ncbi:ATP-binding response regulator [Umezawaea tangerina]|uniref:histidine kinase n=1 Tax=Umezawaea tangerina TaxID=84725 RepID=A0A2T0THF2_9PSEU|nr:ATP-binding protein [Umezawaea tangerina]PRY45124.1 response regulator receiver domain-containing protein [Umezawaea tangerina]